MITVFWVNVPWSTKWWKSLSYPHSKTIRKYKREICTLRACQYWVLSQHSGQLLLHEGEDGHGPCRSKEFPKYIRAESRRISSSIWQGTSQRYTIAGLLGLKHFLFYLESRIFAGVRIRQEKAEGYRKQLSEAVWGKMKEDPWILSWLIWAWYCRPVLPKLFHIVPHF